MISTRQKGLSIIELLVAMVIGLILLLGVSQVFLSSRQTYAANEAMGRLQENGRFALEFIARSARLAGYTEPVFEGGKPLALVQAFDRKPVIEQEIDGGAQAHGRRSGFIAVRSWRP